MFLRKPHSAEMYGISCRNDFRTKQKVFPGNSEILCDRNVVRHYLKPMVIFKGLKNVPCKEIDYSASSQSESNESADEGEKRKTTANWSTLEYLYFT